MKTIKTCKRADGLVKAVVKFDEDLNEYQVRLIKAGKEHKPARYHTDDEGDAIGTAELMVKA
jgi:hypothetical protein